MTVTVTRLDLAASLIDLQGLLERYDNADQQFALTDLAIVLDDNELRAVVIESGMVTRDDNDEVTSVRLLGSGEYLPPIFDAEDLEELTAGEAIDMDAADSLIDVVSWGDAIHVETGSERLRRVMREHGLTQPVVARICKVSRETVRSWLAPSRPVDAPEGYVDLVELTLQASRRSKKGKA